jgi:hypothetical protein
MGSTEAIVFYSLIGLCVLIDEWMDPKKREQNNKIIESITEPSDAISFIKRPIRL